MSTEKAPSATSRCRIRDLGIAVGQFPCGRCNAITDVGVLVGHSTLKTGEGKLVPGEGPVRTGVTVILPHSGDLWNKRCSAGCFVLNGNGNVTGLEWLRESGVLEGPIALTNTHSVGDVYRAVIRWMSNKHAEIGITDDTYLPVVAECDDSHLNDIRGMHVQEDHVFAALDSATSGTVAEGAVGAGTGMIAFDFKGGIGTSSRVVQICGAQYTVGVLCNCNMGEREQLLVGGVPIGRLLPENKATEATDGSIVMIVATDAPLSPLQLNRLAKRTALGMARTGATANHSSGDFVLAFSTTRTMMRDCQDAVLCLPQLNDEHISPLYHATADAAEEAILNALCAAETVVGRDGNLAPAMPLPEVESFLKRFGRV